ncbi:hypothetical protein KUTeg_012278 [Tegillarca granosa]|uniref:Uncharacterized protein n=1 Tax=Tegillarca granosa TaxID=220873 RepID=A0ABQ9EZ39_TEGGR|nr:hypothetical protein KUTeg_012278 [Tegillarca granosa]
MLSYRLCRCLSYGDELDDIQKDFGDWKLMFYPEFATIVNIYKYNDRLESYNALNPINFMEGPQTDPNNYVGGIPFDTEGDFVNYLNRLSQIPRQNKRIDHCFGLPWNK